MNLFDLLGDALGLSLGRIARLVATKLESRRLRGRVAVIGEPLARALADDGCPVVAVLDEPRRRRKGPPRLVARPAALPFPDGALAAACAVGDEGDDPAVLDELARVVRPGGLVIAVTPLAALVGRAPPAERIAARFLHALLVELEQHEVGSTLVTWGQVRAFGVPLVAVDRPRQLPVEDSA